MFVLPFSLSSSFNFFPFLWDEEHSQITSLLLLASFVSDLRLAWLIHMPTLR